MLPRMKIGFERRRRADDLISEVDHIADREHFVHFYAHDDQLADGVARYFAVGFAQGELGIAIATPEHLHAIDTALARLSLDPQALKKGGHYSVFDAQEMLSGFLTDGKLDAARFRTGVLGAWMRAAARSGRKVRAFGEMVACLWSEGKTDDALELERLWNELGQTSEFALYCAYPASVATEGDGHAFTSVCREHSRIIRTGVREAIPA